MKNYKIQEKIEKLRFLSVEKEFRDLGRSLLHAYIACLSAKELCTLAQSCFEENAILVEAIRRRLLRLARDGGELAKINDLVNRLILEAPRSWLEKRRREALFSHLYCFLNPDTRLVLLERWSDAGTKDSGARWLKAISGDPMHFHISQILLYWRNTGDWRASRILVDRADKGVIEEILPDLVRHCDEGWVISRAVLKGIEVTDDIWAAIRVKFPASYLYLCAKTGREADEDDAYNIVEELTEGFESERGLAIWAMGELCMEKGLDRIWSARKEFRRKELAALGVHLDVLVEG